MADLRKSLVQVFLLKLLVQVTVARNFLMCLLGFTYFHYVGIHEVSNVVSLPDLRDDVVILVWIRQNIVLYRQQKSQSFSCWNSAFFRSDKTNRKKHMWQHCTYFSDPGNTRLPFPVLNLSPTHNKLHLVTVVTLTGRS